MDPIALMVVGMVIGLVLIVGFYAALARRRKKNHHAVNGDETPSGVE